jgi:hypothetical protein
MKIILQILKYTTITIGYIIVTPFVLALLIVIAALLAIVGVSWTILASIIFLIQLIIVTSTFSLDYIIDKFHKPKSHNLTRINKIHSKSQKEKLNE